MVLLRKHSKKSRKQEKEAINKRPTVYKFYAGELLRSFPEVLNPNINTKTKLQLIPLAETGHVVPKVALLL